LPEVLAERTSNLTSTKEFVSINSEKASRAKIFSKEFRPNSTQKIGV
jgi:hypothetical protein